MRLEISSAEVVWFANIISLMSFPLFVGVLYLSLFCDALLCAHSCFAIILKKKRKLVIVHLVELFDLKQMIMTPTRVTQNTSSIIDHLYCSNPDYISDCFVPKYSISDHFPICFTRKINSKVKRSCDISTTYRCFKYLNEETFLADLSEDFSRYFVSESDIETDLTAWYDILLIVSTSLRLLKRRGLKPSECPHGIILTLHKHADKEI